MSKSGKDKLVIKGYTIEDVPDTPHYANRTNDQCQNSWVYKSPSPMVRPEIELVNGNIHFSCSCGKRVMMPVAYAGKKGKCPACGKVIKIPILSV